MAVEEDEALRLHGARDIDDGNLLTIPAFHHLGDDGRAFAVARRRDDLLPVRIVHGDDGDRRLPRQIVVQVPQWMSTPGLTAITALAPHSSRREQEPGLAKPAMTTTLPLTRARTSPPSPAKISEGSRV